MPGSRIAIEFDNIFDCERSPRSFFKNFTFTDPRIKTCIMNV